ncbi:major facilitator transporter [Caballeronia pedi]|uniref:Major facilitator transporter n=1 Tax=Caballeronia pedi TaxID=1777141 RepID=A0A158DZ30_9BURK|nr:MFS transporter [Caballeronia pedi]SAK99670.1 major facilitator transporter [Caballeronia pedi]
MKDDASAAALPQQLARTEGRTNVRWMMLGLVFIGTIINYLDRANMSVVAPLISKEFSISPVAMGFLFSAFSWAFAISTIPGGYLLDRFGTKLVYGLCLTAWSLATTLQILAGGFASLFGLRFGVGAAEAPAFPANNKVATSWFPQREIGVAGSVCSMGIYLGTALLTPVEFYIAERYGWRGVFLSSGVVGLIWAVVWFLFYREPGNSKLANRQELDYIQQGKAAGSPAGKSAGFRWEHCLKLLSFRQMWGVCIGKFAATTTLYFFLTWFPTYLIQARGMTMLHAGAAAIGPYLAAAAGVMFGGWWGDWMVRKGFSVTFARKLPMVIGLLLTGSIVLANFTTSNSIVMVILCFAFFAQGMSSTTWVILSEISPLKLVGMTGSIASFASNIAGIVTPITIGFIVQKTGSFEWALGFCAIVSLVGVLSYTLLMGPVKRLEVE